MADVANLGFQITDQAQGGLVIMSMQQGDEEIVLNLVRGARCIRMSLEECFAVQRCIAAMDYHLPDKEKERLLVLTQKENG